MRGAYKIYGVLSLNLIILQQPTNEEMKIKNSITILWR